MKGFVHMYLYGTDLPWCQVELLLSPSQTTWLINTFTYAPDSRDSEAFRPIEVGSLEEKRFPKMGGDCCGRQIGGHVTNEGMSSQSCDTPRNAAAL